MSESAGTPANVSGGAIGATAIEARSLAPDLARGGMLLLIALANAHVYLFGHEIGVRRYPVVGTVSSQVITLLQMAFVDGRAYPLFAGLFGYSIVQLSRRQAAGGLEPKALRKLIRRRGWVLLLFGFAHALLLFSGDIIGSYGLLGAAMAGVLLRARDRTLLLVAGVWFLPVGVYGLLQGLPVPGRSPPLVSSMSVTNPLVAAGFRMDEWSTHTLRQVMLSLVPALLLGVWAARRRVLDEPERYRRWLRRAAVWGVGTAVAGGLPMALMASTVWEKPGFAASILAGLVHTVSGYAGGIGYAAIAGLAALHFRERQGPFVMALKACGQRSMSCYLGQSIVLVALLPAYSGGLGDDIGIAAAAGLAVLTWGLTVVAADAMQRFRFRGPAEVLLRRFTYGPAVTWRGGLGLRTRLPSPRTPESK